MLILTCGSEEREGNEDIIRKTNCPNSSEKEPEIEILGE